MWHTHKHSVLRLNDITGRHSLTSSSSHSAAFSFNYKMCYTIFKHSVLCVQRKVHTVWYIMTFEMSSHCQTVAVCSGPLSGKDHDKQVTQLYHVTCVTPVSSFTCVHLFYTNQTHPSWLLVTNSTNSSLQIKRPVNDLSSCWIWTFSLFIPRQQTWCQMNRQQHSLMSRITLERGQAALTQAM